MKRKEKAYISTIGEDNKDLELTVAIEDFEDKGNSEKVDKKVINSNDKHKTKNETESKSIKNKKKAVLGLSVALLAFLTYETINIVQNLKPDVFQSNEPDATIEETVETESTNQISENINEEIKNEESEKTEIDLETTEEDLNRFEDSMKTKCGEVVNYDIVENILYCFCLKDDNLTLYQLELTEKDGFVTQSQINNLISRLGELSEVGTIKSEENFLDYKAKRYNLNAIKGANIFAERVGVATDNIVTSVNVNRTENGAEMNVFVIGDNKFVAGKITSSFEGPLSDVEIIEKLLSDKTSESTVQKVTGFGYSKYNDFGDKPEKIYVEDELYFQDLEDKIKTELDGFIKGFSLEEVVAYAINKKQMSIIIRGNNDGNVIYRVFAQLPEEYDLKTQNGIDQLQEVFSKDLLEKDKDYEDYGNRILREYFELEDEDVEIDGVKYSKNGIFGENPFSKKSEKENVLVTFIHKNANGQVEYLALYENQGAAYLESEEYIDKSHIKYRKYMGTLIGGSCVKNNTTEKSSTQSSELTK